MFQVLRLEQVDSTNRYLMDWAMQGAGHGQAVVAESQTGGRGRLGRSFECPVGGLYLSVLLRPREGLEALPTLTARVAAAVCRGVERACGVCPDIKWPNDLQLGGKKLCGILCELGMEGDATYVVVGIGLNVDEPEGGFSPEVAALATTLARHAPGVDREGVLACILEELEALDRVFPHGWEADRAFYRGRCVTLGQRVEVLRGEARRGGRAVDLGEDFALRVAWDNGGEEWVRSGEVSLHEWS